MHENQQTKESDQVLRRTRAQRPYRFYVMVNHRLADVDGSVAAPELLAFDDKSLLRAGLDNAKYEGAQLRIFRGYEMKVKAKRQITVN